ncbi:uncharacterized protein LOC110053955 [Orbicella faveolata]|uniref:uncharacterized protein LOC110053955 n=1 Tax=Orbicella faveolata TaxID=48498 RepID=UPI0009E29571|nr:uncharacterized protein LOC110053955 [Orbicella faveolata]XP_020615935.1 uncharacterized protein LOC110053955 [Orbicella faveolata]
MAADGEEMAESPVSLKGFELRSPTSFINSPLAFTKDITRVPLQRIRCGKLDIRNEERWLEYEPLSRNLKFLYKDRKHFDHEYCTFLNCQQISAADLRVSAKFGYLDAMTGTLTVECQELVEIDGPHHRGSSASSRSYVLEATFHVNYTGQVRDILRSLRHAKLVESASDCETFPGEGATRGVADIAMPCSEKKLREGLPDWTPYIPHRVYTPAVRKLIESVITLYTIFSILWAVWQLYRHVDFIRAYVQPIIDTLKYHVELMDKCIQFLNSLFEEMTKQWLAYVKPGYVILSSFASPLIAVGREMWTAFVSISAAFALFFQPLYHVFEPLFKVIYMVFIKTPYTIFQPAFAVGVKCCSLCYNTVFCHVVLSQLNRIRGSLGWLVEILEKSMKLDPLKAQLVLMRSTVINSGKALSLGLVYIFKSIERRVWLMIARPVDNKDD